MNKIAIIGGGTGGLTAAIFLKMNNKSLSVTVFDRMDRVGKKLLATGNGRCNLSNKNCRETISQGGKTVALHYFGADRTFPLFALQNFTETDLAAWFNELGMPTTYEQDKLFPYSLNAATVLDVLRLKCEQLNVNFKLGTAVESIKKSGSRFVISGETYDKVIIAAGGKAQESLGSDGSGYKLLQSFSHTLSPLYPSITQIKTDTTFVRQLKGLKVNANCKIYINQRLIREEYGQLLFADYGLSGPPIFSLSRVASVYGDKCKILLDLMPDYDIADVEKMVEHIANKPFCANLTLENLLTPMMNKRVGQVIVKYLGYKLNAPVNMLKKIDFNRIAGAIKGFELKVTGVKGYNIAQVTAGGIMTDKFDCQTMQSKLCRGLYAIGEVLDVDGDCGGYNLQWAFSSAYICAKSITEDNK